MIIILDGSKGAGKSTASDLLCTKLENLVPLSLDNERHALNDQGGTLEERNIKAFISLLDNCRSSVRESKNVVIDCGLVAGRLLQFESLAKEEGARLYRFLLTASYEAQLERVKARDVLKGKETDKERFDKVHKVIHDKPLDGAVVIETDKNTPEEVVGIILETISSK